MKNVTLSLDDQTYRRARITAAERNQSVSALVRGYLQSLQPAADDAGDRAASLFVQMDRARGFRAANRLTREAANERKRTA